MSGNIPPPLLENTPPKNDIADAMGTLAVLAMGCELGDPKNKAKCQEIIKPLEEGKQKAVQTMKNMIVEFGPEVMDDAMDKINIIAFEAATLAKEELIAKGLINQDGTPKE